MSSRRGRGRGTNTAWTGYRAPASNSGSRPGRYSTSALEDIIAESLGRLSIQPRSDTWFSATASSATRITRQRPQQPVSDTEIDNYVNSVIQSVKPCQRELSVKQQLVRDLEKIVRQVFDHAELAIMGGLGNGFALKDSDVDVCLTNAYGRIDEMALCQLKAKFDKAGYLTELLLHTYIPLLRLAVRPRDWHTPIQVEISWSNSSGIHKTSLLAAYSQIDPRVKSLVMFIKHWSKRRGLSNTTPGQGGMGSFAWSLLCIYFLMKGAGGGGGEGAVVPCLQRGRGESDVGFRRDVPKDWSSNTKSIGRLVREFFQFVNAFDFDTRVISIRRPDEDMRKSDKGWISGLVRGYGDRGQRVRHSYYIAIEDPFNNTGNAARTVSCDMYVKIKREFERAVGIFNGTANADGGLHSLCAERFARSVNFDWFA